MSDRLVKLKVAELTGPALDFAVAKCEGWRSDPEEESYGIFCGLLYPPEAFTPDEDGTIPNLGYFCASSIDDLKYSSDWGLSGPIIEREQIATLCPRTGDFWDARSGKVPGYSYWRGPTILIAAMRCYVVSKIGEYVEIPKSIIDNVIGETTLVNEVN